MKTTIKYLLITVLLIGSLSNQASAQDIPLFSQKLSNSFLYNPSVAGQQFGSVTLAHRSLFAKVDGSQRDIFFSAHKPFFDKHVGVGLNVFSEKVNFVNNVFVSGAFAYHLRLAGGSLLSMGLAGEFNSMGFDRSAVIGEEGDVLIQDRLSRLDFSSGASLITENFELGISANRLASMLNLSEQANLISEYFSVHYKHIIDLDGNGSMIEPMANFRQLSSKSHLWSVGGFYTYNDLLIGGLAYESSQRISTTLGGKFMDKYHAGLSYSTHINGFRKDLGGSLEFVLRIDIDKNDEQKGRSHFKKSKTQKKNQKINKKKRGSIGR